MHNRLNVTHVLGRQSFIHTHTHMHVHVHIHTHTPTHTHTHMHTYTIQSHIYRHTYTNLYLIDTHTHTHTHTYRHSVITLQLCVVNFQNTGSVFKYILIYPPPSRPYTHHSSHIHNTGQRVKSCFHHLLTIQLSSGLLHSFLTTPFTYVHECDQSYPSPPHPPPPPPPSTTTPPTPLLSTTH